MELSLEDKHLIRLALLTAVERTGDHDHGKGPIAPGMKCPGGDCIVHEVRTFLRS